MLAWGEDHLWPSSQTGLPEAGAPGAISTNEGEDPAGDIDGS
jgi:hypothetical protein